MEIWVALCTHSAGKRRSISAKFELTNKSMRMTRDVYVDVLVNTSHPAYVYARVYQHVYMCT